jgi:hypothetical protein
MTEIACPNCGKSSSVNGAGSGFECPFCFEEINATQAVETSTARQEIQGLKLTYQINQQAIDIPPSGKTFLGRDAVGANVLSNIFFNGKQVISRKHCSVDFRDNTFYLQDEGSLNGTFYGANKTDCRHSPQAIQNGTLVFLGEEPFLATIETKAAANPIHKSEEKPHVLPAITRYRCNDSNCLPDAFEATEVPANKVCPKCGTYDRFVAATG